MSVSSLVHVLSYSFLFPPMLFIVIAIVATCVGVKLPRVGLATAFVSLMILCAFATPFVSDRLMALLERQVPPVPEGAEPAAIVVLGADIQTSGESEAGDTLGYLSLERVLMAANEYRKLHLPILVSGGLVTRGHSPVAALMAAVLEDDLKIEVRWRELKSSTTLENAEFSAAILRAAGISTVVLVAQRWDMPRAIWAFGLFGITAIPSRQARLLTPTTGELTDFIPTASGIYESFLALHEMIGLLYYRSEYPMSDVARASASEAPSGVH